jgi:broad specificity phosphatase PhoE
MQARTVAGRLSKETWHILYSSDLSRAKHTAEHLNEHLGVPHHVEPGLRERNFGPLEGMTRTEIDSQYPNVLHHPHAPSIPGIESYEALMQRVKETIESIARRHFGKRVLIVSHGGTINAFLHSVTGQRNNRIENTAITRLRFDGTDWHVDCINDHQHLADLSV